MRRLRWRDGKTPEEIEKINKSIEQSRGMGILGIITLIGILAL